MAFKLEEGGQSFLFDEASVAELHLSIFKASDRATEKAFLFFFFQKDLLRSHGLPPGMGNFPTLTPG